MSTSYDGVLSFLEKHSDFLMASRAYVNPSFVDEVKAIVPSMNVSTVMRRFIQTGCGMAKDLILEAIFGLSSSLGEGIELTATTQIEAILTRLDTTGVIVINITPCVVYPSAEVRRLARVAKYFEHLLELNVGRTPAINHLTPSQVAMFYKHYTAPGGEANFPGHSLVVVKCGADYSVVQAYIMSHGIRQRTVTHVDLVGMLTKYLTFIQGETFTGADEELWKAVTGSVLQGSFFTPKTLVGYSKCFNHTMLTPTAGLAHTPHSIQIIVECGFKPVVPSVTPLQHIVTMLATKQKPDAGMIQAVFGTDIAGYTKILAQVIEEAT